MDATKESAESAELVREAADLWLRAEVEPANPRLLAEVDEWRARSDTHDRIYRAAAEAWTLAGSHMVSALPASRRRRGGARRSIGQPRRMAAIASAATAAACMALLVAPSVMLSLESDYRTGTGEKQSVTLADGSHVTLDADSAIALDYANGRRGVRLLAGRAWFDIASDRSRPFVVAAADTHVTVTGTAFDVGLGEEAVDVALAEGSVRVDWRSGTAALKPGDRLRVSRASHRATRSQSSTEAMGGWRRDRLMLEDVSLAEGVAMLARYHRGAIVIKDKALGERRVTGVFDTRTPDEALRLMVRQHGATVHEITPLLLIVAES